MIGLDTTAVIDLFKGDPAIKAFLEKNKEPVATNIMNHLEVHFGIDPGNPKHAQEAKYYEEFFRNTYFLGLTPEVNKKASSIHWELKRKGTPIAKFDCIMAACFLEHGVKRILTRNTKDFKHVTGLAVIGY